MHPLILRRTHSRLDQHPKYRNIITYRITNATILSFKFKQFAILICFNFFSQVSIPSSSGVSNHSETIHHDPLKVRYTH